MRRKCKREEKAKQSWLYVGDMRWYTRRERIWDPTSTADAHWAEKVRAQAKRLDEMLNHQQSVSVRVNSIRSKFSKPLICSVGTLPVGYRLAAPHKNNTTCTWEIWGSKNVRPPAAQSWLVCVCERLRRGLQWGNVFRNHKVMQPPRRIR